MSRLRSTERKHLSRLTSLEAVAFFFGIFLTLALGSCRLLPLVSLRHHAICFLGCALLLLAVDK